MALPSLFCFRLNKTAWATSLGIFSQLRANEPDLQEYLDIVLPSDNLADIVLQAAASRDPTLASHILAARI